jgi:hypothetical protein
MHAKNRLWIAKTHEKKVLAVVIVEALAILPTIPLGVDHAFQEYAGSIFRVARSLIESFLDSETGIESDAV